MTQTDIKMSWAAGKKRVLCVGPILMEQINLVRKHPKINEEICNIKGKFQRGGGASIIATVLRNFGVTVEQLSMLSTSDVFKRILEDIRKRGIIAENCPYTDACPPMAIVIVPKTERQSLVTVYDNFPKLTPDDFKKLDLNNYGWVHFRGVDGASTIEMMKFVLAHKEKIIISMDLFKNINELFPLVDYCDFVILNKFLAESLNWQTPDAACVNFDEKLRMRSGINLKRPYVLLPWEFEGAYFIDLHGKCTHIPGYKPKKVVDTYGADSVFHASFIYATYVRERSFTEAIDFANRMYSEKCKHLGFDHLVHILRAPVL